MLGFLIGTQKKKVLESLDYIYNLYTKKADSLEKAAYDLHDKAKKSRVYLESIEKMKGFDMINNDLLESYLVNIKRNEEDVASLMKRSITYRAMADYVWSIYTIVKNSDLDRRSLNRILLNLVDKLNEFGESLQRIYLEELDTELNSIIS